jgi:hypothetical protein
MVNRFKIGILAVSCSTVWCIAGGALCDVHAAEKELVRKAVDVKAIAPTSKVGEALVECICSTISPSNWEAAGGNATIKFQRGELTLDASDVDCARVERLVAALAELPAIGAKEARATPKSPRITIEDAKDDSTAMLVVYPVTDLLQGVGASFDMEAFLDLIFSTIEPSSWDNVGGDGYLREFQPRGALIVGQSKATIEQIDALLAALRKAPAIDNKMLAKPPKDLAIAAGSFSHDGEKLTAVVYPVADLVSDGKSVWRRPDGSQNFDFDSLIETVTQFVRPTTWDAVGGIGSVKEFVPRLALVISHTAETHKEIESLFSALRNIPHFSAKSKKLVPRAPATVGTLKRGDAELQVVVYDVGAKILIAGDEADFLAIIEAVWDIAPSSWDANGGAGTLREFSGRGALVVANTKDNQAQIAKAIEKFKLPRN